MDEQTSKGLVLVVDDTPNNIDVLSDVLESGHYTIITATRGEAALFLAERDQPDIILLDIMMPGMDGFEVCKRLKQNKYTRDIPIIFMTALTETEDKIKGFDLGAVDYVTKPFHYKEVLARVGAHLTTRRLQRELQSTNERLEQRVNERTAELREEVAVRKAAEQTLRSIAEATAATTGGDFLRSLVEQMALTLGVHTVFITSRTDESESEVRTLAWWDENQLLENFDYELEGTACKLVVQEGEMKFYKESLGEFFPKQANFESFIGLPIQDANGEILGHIAVLDKKALIDEKRFVDILRIFAARVGAELERQRVEDELRQTNAAYSRFVPTQFLNLLQHQSILNVELGDHIEIDMTILFADIRSFTSLSEQMSPQDNFRFINAFLKRVSPIIRHHKGFIDKYLGDGVMALFPESTDNGIQAAVEIQNSVREYNKERLADGFDPLRVGIGVHFGRLMLGTIGEAERMEGTVISDAVNLASRLEGLTKLYHVPVVISEQTMMQLEQTAHYQLRPLGKVRVKGKRDVISVYEIFDAEVDEVSRLKLSTRRDLEAGLNFFYDRKMREASEKFEAVLSRYSTDRVAQLYLDRARDYLEYGEPPPEDDLIAF
jgi:two-component system sensor histidine kinase ChiS